jgi:hypothetical protein
LGKRGGFSAAVFADPSVELRRVIESVGLQIFRNVGVDQPDLAAARIGVGFLPCRSDSTSVPVSAKPASKVSSMK